MTLNSEGIYKEVIKIKIVKIKANSSHFWLGRVTLFLSSCIFKSLFSYVICLRPRNSRIRAWTFFPVVSLTKSRLWFLVDIIHQPQDQAVHQWAGAHRALPWKVRARETQKDTFKTSTSPKPFPVGHTIVRHSPESCGSEHNADSWVSLMYKPKAH